MLGDITFGGDNKIIWGRNTDSASISFKNDGDGDADSYMSFVTSDNGNEYFRWSHNSGSTNTEWMALRSDGLRVGGTKVSLEGHSHNDLYYTKTEVNNKLNDKSDSGHNHDDRYLKLTGGTISGRLLVNSNSNSYTTPSIAINYYDSYTVNDYSITQIKMGNPKYDMYLGLSPAVKGRYGKIGYFMHANTDCEFLWGTSGWIKRMALECSSGNLWVSGSITAGKFHSNASASTDLTVIPPDTAIALETGNGNGVVNSWIWRENYTSSNWGIFHNNSEDDSINFVGNNRIRVKISLGSNSLKVGGTEVSLEGHNHDDRYVKKSGDIMLGALNFANGTWNLVGDDVYMGDHNIGG